jgi:ribonuclease HI
MIIFTDGSSFVSNKSKTALISWAILVEHDDFHTEQSGCLKVDAEDRHLHEVLAFVHAASYAHMHKFAPHAVSFFTDDYMCSRASYINNVGGSSLHPRMEHLLDRLSKYVAADVIENAKQYLMGSRVSKIKGHANCVNNLRVDYLATMARKISQGADVEIWPFADWLSKRAIVSKWIPTFASA